MVIKLYGMSNEFLEDNFISGIKEDIGAQINMSHPTSRLEASRDTTK